MQKEMLFIAVLTATIASGGCASAYKPSERVTAMMNEMSAQQARDELYRFLQPRNNLGNPTKSAITGHIGLGLCKSYPFTLDDELGPAIEITADEISLNVVRAGKLLKSSTQGHITSATGMTVTNHYERIPYREHLRFDKIDAISISEPGLLSTTCGRQSGQSEAFIRESMTRWYTTLIPTAEKERFIAVWLRLKPDVRIKE